MRRHAITGALATIVGAALLLRLVYGPPYLNYDASYSLVWAHDIAHGLTPDYDGFIAPTPHPLQTFVSFLALPLGDATPHVLAWLVLLCFGGIVYVVFLLGRLRFSSPVGVLAAAVLLTRPAFGRNAELAYQDIPFALFVVWALLLELRTPKRGAPVLVLLTLAGLLRPEAWVLAGLYWLWLVHGSGAEDRARLVRLAVLAVTAPVLWAISDAAITGDLLHSFHGTKDLAAQLDRPRSPLQAPYRTAKFLGFTLREPLIVGVPIGCAFIVLLARQGVVLLGVAGVMLLLFLLSTIGGLPLIARYVLTPTVLLAVVYAAGCLGWRELPKGSPERRRWRWIGLGSLALSILFIPFNVDLIRDVRTKVTHAREIQTDLQDVADSPVFRTFLGRCGRVSTFDHPEVPPLRYYVGGAPGSVMDVKDPAHPLAQTLLMPIDDTVSKRYYQGRPPLTVPAGFQEVFRSTSWRLMASPGCRAAVQEGRALAGAERR